MRYYKYTMLTVLSAVIFFVSCTREERGSYIYPEYSSYSFGCEADSARIYVMSDADWSVSADADWLSAEHIIDGNGQWLIVSVQKNMNLEPRQTSVTLTGEGIMEDVLIHQSGVTFSGLFEDIPEFPSTYGCKPSKNISYILGVKDADAEGYCIAEIINTKTGERRELEASSEYDYAVAISDEGDDYILKSRKYGNYYVYIDNQKVDLEIPEGYTSSGVAIENMSGDGRVIVGALYSEESGTGRFPCRWVDGTCEILKRPDSSSHGTKTEPYGTLARDCSADGSVVYGTEWTYSSYALAFWRDGQLFYPGGDYAVKNGGLSDRIYKTAEYNALSSNGKYLAATYGTVSGEAYPVIIDTETYDVKILKDISNNMVGITCSNDGLLFASSPSIGVTQGHVIDPVAGTCVSTSEYFKSVHGLNLTSGRMVERISSDGNIYFGMQARYTTLGVQYSFWYLNLNPEK